MPFRFQFPEEKFKVRKAHDFDELRFVATGSLMDMRKGQYPVLYALLDFYHNHYKPSPEKYRNFHVEFIGAYEKSDLGMHSAYHVKNIKKQFDLSALGLGNHYSITATMSHEKAIEKIEKANITICYSLHEALPIFVYEGMAAGHPLIRNESPGQEEQLVDGENGFAVSSKDFAGLVEVIEELLNKNKTSNEDLAKMSKLSNEIAQKATSNEYSIIEDIRNAVER
jgi:glycosyltransferase involved in cell wall biosynthesis